MTKHIQDSWVHEDTLTLFEALRGILDRAEIDMDDGDLALKALSDIRQEARAAIAKVTGSG